MIRKIIKESIDFNLDNYAKWFLQQLNKKGYIWYLDFEKKVKGSGYDTPFGIINLNKIKEMNELSSIEKNEYYKLISSSVMFSKIDYNNNLKKSEYDRNIAFKILDDGIIINNVKFSIKEIDIIYGLWWSSVKRGYGGIKKPTGITKSDIKNLINSKFVEITGNKISPLEYGISIMKSEKFIKQLILFLKNKLKNDELYYGSIYSSFK